MNEIFRACTIIRRVLTPALIIAAAVLLLAQAFAQEEPAQPTPVDRPSLAEAVPDLPQRFTDCRERWGSTKIPASVVIFRAGIIERVPTTEAWAPLEFFGGTESTTDDHWILGSCTRGA